MVDLLNFRRPSQLALIVNFEKNKNKIKERSYAEQIGQINRSGVFKGYSVVGVKQI